MTPETPMKRKRGRPPKAGSLSNKITTTLNINVNTGSLHNTPTAESNSNMMIKRGAPDIMTPLMKVSPSSRRKKVRRQSSTSSISSAGSPDGRLGYTCSIGQHTGHQNVRYSHYVNGMYDNGSMMMTNGFYESNSISNEDTYISNVPTPLSISGNRGQYTPSVNAKTLDNLSTITQENTSLYYNTPPSSTLKSHYQSNTWPSPIGEALSGSPISIGSGDKSKKYLDNGIPNKIDLLPAASIKSSKERQLDERNEYSKPQVHGRYANGSSSVKSSPKEKLENSEIKNRNNSCVSNDTKGMNNFRKNSISTTCEDSKDFSLKLMIDDSGKAVLSKNIFEGPIGDDKKEGFESEIQNKIPSNNLANGSYKSEDKLSLAKSTEPQQKRHDHHSPLKKYHSEACIIVPTPSSIKNSDESTTILPSTPKAKDHYLLTSANLCNTGFTPNASNLTFNLTPQFNSMIYSMVGINSSQQNNYHKRINSVQLFNNQESSCQNNHSNHNNHNNQNQNNSEQNYSNSTNIQHDINQYRSPYNEETINVVELMNIGSSNGVGNSMKYSNFNNKLPSVASSLNGVPLTGFQSIEINDDLSDARLALKKLVYVKRGKD